MNKNRAKKAPKPNWFLTPSHTSSAAAPRKSRTASPSITQPRACAPRKRSFRSGMAARFSCGAEAKKRLALDVGVDHPAEVGGIALELFEVAVRLVARKRRGQYERRVAEQIVSHVRLVGDLVFCPLEDPADQRLVGGRGGQLADGAAEAPLEADFSFAHSFLCMMRFS